MAKIAQAAREFAYWCKLQCLPGKGCKLRQKPGMTWEELRKLCPKAKP